MTRVVVTGLGMISAAGMDVDANWLAAIEGSSAIRLLSASGSSQFSDCPVALLDGFDPSLLPSRVRSSAARFSQFAVLAAEQAVRDAQISQSQLSSAAVIVGCSVGGIDFLEQQYANFFGSNQVRTHPMTIPKLMPSAASSQVSMHLGARGLSYTVSSACASSNHAIGQAFKLLQSGGCDLAIAGGAEASITPGSMEAWRALHVTATDTCRPFCKTRSGMAVGEGAAMLILEPMGSAIARGARVYCEIVGYGASSDAGRLTAPDVDGMTLAMRRALRDAGVTEARVSYVNAHGTGTQLNDAAEVSAIKQLFADASELPLVSSSKAVFGHTLGAAGAIEAVVVCKAIENGIAPPTANYQQLDPDCDIDVVPGVARMCEMDLALSNAFAFGGINTALLFAKLSY
jgi:nodulation protein E